MQLANAYVCTAYAVVVLCCVVGAFNRTYDANLAQRIALALFALWSVWRIQLVSQHGWGYPHETMVVSALLLYAVGSASKTLKYIRAARRGNRRIGDG